MNVRIRVGGIRRFRARANLTQEALAELTGKGRESALVVETVSRHEREETTATRLISALV